MVCIIDVSPYQSSLLSFWLLVDSHFWTIVQRLSLSYNYPVTWRLSSPNSGTASRPICRGSRRYHVRRAWRLRNEGLGGGDRTRVDLAGRKVLWGGMTSNTASTIAPAATNACRQIHRESVLVKPSVRRLSPWLGRPMLPGVVLGRVFEGKRREIPCMLGRSSEVWCSRGRCCMVLDL